MGLLQSNYRPVVTDCETFVDCFYKLLSNASRLDIAVGYITADSLVELQEIVECNNLSQLNLIIGMHYLDKFTQIQYKAACRLNDYLRNRQKGEVRLVKPFKYHGKLYLYSNENGAFASIVGSNNLGSIVKDNNRIYETSYLIDSKEDTSKVQSFISKLSASSTANIADCEISEFRENNDVLGNLENVEKISHHEHALCLNSFTSTRFEIPIKDYDVAPRSSLNAFFGKGRETPNGLIQPRHWYESEIIVPKEIATSPGYPVSKTEESQFIVMTDDGWKFSCKISGQNNKNFRSNGDLKILGKWLKGRLENAGVLEVGNPVTKETLDCYGRTSFSFIKTTIPNTWYLDFKSKNENILKSLS